jgi:PST family polysaccharide transporter
MAATVSGFLGVVGDSGITVAVMRLPEIDRAAESTGFWLALIGAGILAVISAVAAPILGRLYGNSEITWVSIALASGFLLGAPMRVSAAKLSRKLRFRELTIINMLANTVATGVAVLLAARGFGVWALVEQGTATVVLQTAMTVVVCPPATSLRLWSRTRARSLGHAGSRLSGFSLAIAVGRSLDTILAGRFLGPSAFGFMSMGMKLVYLPVERFCGAIYTVFLPATVELDLVARQSRAFKSAMRLLMIFVAPLSLGIVAVAPEIIMLLPPRWSGLTPILRLYAATTLVLPLGYLSMSVLVAHGLTSALLRTALALIPISWAGAIAGALSGSVLAMVAAWSFAITAGGVAFLWLIWRRLALGRDFWIATLVPVAMSAVMGVAVRLSLKILGLGGSRLGFVVGAVLGFLFYTVLAWLGMRTDLVRAGRLLRESIARRGTTSSR